MDKQSPDKSSSEEPKSKIGRFFSKIGYSVWLTVMIIGAILAFITSFVLL